MPVGVAGPYHLPVQARPVRQDDLGHGAAVAVFVHLTDGHLLAEGQFGSRLLRVAPKVLPGLRGVDAVESDLHLPLLGGQHSDCIAVGDPHDLRHEVGGQSRDGANDEEQK